MKKERTGWAVVTECHPTNGEPMIADFSFEWTRVRAIREFVGGVPDTKKQWQNWRKKFGFKAVKAKITIEIL